ncbi:MAG: hypothetical protein AT707_05685 [Pyrobaculum sp. JCHS_4]|nr:MAG: hypothetical protein AT707_05685 [Pyrobaculum sp. JCHS_4]
MKVAGSVVEVSAHYLACLKHVAEGLSVVLLYVVGDVVVQLAAAPRGHEHPSEGRVQLDEGGCGSPQLFGRLWVVSSFQ